MKLRTRCGTDRSNRSAASASVTFLVLDGRFDIALRDVDGAETTVALHQGDVFVVPRGTEDKPSSPGGSILMFEPQGTSTTGDRHEGEIPAHVDSTTGLSLD
ncbi:hypothetical protein [Stackebrandtia nassauensis]|uniref:hypothetical protein n=1 Tax=Stackebrandtia nassauensis TaxID=283811 RepID=UPI001FCBFD6C|nr:hypothetical protein [Stackebrandtia nassauensis]